MKHYTKEEIKNIIKNPLKFQENLINLEGDFFYYCKKFNIFPPQELFFVDNKLINYKSALFVIENYGADLLAENNKEKLLNLITKKNIYYYVSKNIYDYENIPCKAVVDFASEALNLLDENSFDYILDLIKHDVHINVEDYDIENMQIRSGDYKKFLSVYDDLKKFYDEKELLSLFTKTINKEITSNPDIKVENLIDEVLNFYVNLKEKSHILLGGILNEDLTNSLDPEIIYHPKFIDGVVNFFKKYNYIEELMYSDVDKETINEIVNTWVSGNVEAFSKENLKKLFEMSFPDPGLFPQPKINKLLNVNIDPTIHNTVNTYDFYDKLSLEDMLSSLYRPTFYVTLPILQYHFSQIEQNNQSINSFKKTVSKILKEHSIDILDMNSSSAFLNDISSWEDYPIELCMMMFENLNFCQAEKNITEYYLNQNGLLNDYIEDYLDNNKEFTAKFLNKLPMFLLLLKTNTLEKLLEKHGKDIFNNQTDFNFNWFNYAKSDPKAFASLILNKEYEFRRDVLLNYVSKNLNPNTGLYFKAMVNSLPKFFNKESIKELSTNSDLVIGHAVKNLNNKANDHNNIFSLLNSMQVNNVSPNMLLALNDYAEKRNDPVIYEIIQSGVNNNLYNIDSLRSLIKSNSRFDNYKILENYSKNTNQEILIEDDKVIEVLQIYNSMIVSEDNFEKILNKFMPFEKGAYLKDSHEFYNQSYLYKICGDLLNNGKFSIIADIVESPSSVFEMTDIEPIFKQYLQTLGDDKFIELCMENAGFGKLVKHMVKGDLTNILIKDPGYNLNLPNQKVYSALVDVLDFKGDTCDDHPLLLLSLFKKDNLTLMNDIMTEHYTFMLLSELRLVPRYQVNQFLKDKEKIVPFTPEPDQLLDIYIRNGGIKSYFTANFQQDVNSDGRELFEIYLNNAFYTQSPEEIEHFNKKRTRLLERSKEFPELYVLLNNYNTIDNFFTDEEYQEFSKSKEVFEKKYNVEMSTKCWVVNKYMNENIDIDLYLKGIKEILNISENYNSRTINKVLNYAIWSIYGDYSTKNYSQVEYFTLLSKEKEQKVLDFYKQNAPLIYLSKIYKFIKKDNGVTDPINIKDLNLEKLLFPSMEVFVAADCCKEYGITGFRRNFISMVTNSDIQDLLCLTELDYLITDKFKMSLLYEDNKNYIKVITNNVVEEVIKAEDKSTGSIKEIINNHLDKITLDNELKDVGVVKKVKKHKI